MKVRFLLSALCGIGLLVSLPVWGKDKKATIIYAAEMPIIDHKLGGYAQLAGLLKKVRQSAPPSFFFFGGGSLGPSPMAAFDRGSHIIDILNTLEPDAMSVSKREFSYFEEELSLRSYEAAFPLVASNIQDPSTGTNLDGLIDHFMIERDGFRIGLLSVLDETMVKEYLLTRVSVIDPQPIIEQKSAMLRKRGADFILLMHSYNFPFIDSLLQNQVVDLTLFTDPHFDLTRKQQLPIHKNSVFITEPGTVAEIELTLEEHTLSGKTISWQTRKLTEQVPEPRAHIQVMDYGKRLDRLLDEQVGVLSTTMDTRRAVVRSEESAFANFVADALRGFFDTDIALLNGGVIRGEKRYKANTTLSRRDIATELPFRSRIVVLEVTGRALKQAMENGLSMIEKSKGRFLHLSGAKAVFNSKDPAGSRLKKFSIGGKEVEDDKLYRVATSDYLSSGGDDYLMLKLAKKIELNTRAAPLISEVVINQIRHQRQIAPQVEGRLIDLAKEGL